MANRDRLRAVLQSRFLAKEADVWQAVLRERSVPCSPVRTVADFVADEQFEALGMLTGLPHPAIPDLRVVDTPFNLDGGRPVHRRPPPLLGEHSGEILRELGLTDGEIGLLKTSGAVAYPDAADRA